MQMQNRINNPFSQPAYVKSKPSNVSAANSFARSLAVSGLPDGIPTPKSKTTTPQKELSPIDLYEQMTGRCEPTRSSKNVAGVTWTDETLAAFARKDGAEVNTSRAINWNSTGDHVLTDEELGGLREKYDLKNLSGQDFYDLMADLTELDAISAEDIHGMFLKTAAPTGIYPQAGDFSRSSFVSGNIFKALDNELEAISNRKDFMLSKEFWLMNPSTSENKYNDYISYLDSRAYSMNKLRNIFSNIKG